LFYCFAGCSFEAIRDALQGRPWRSTFGLPVAAPMPLADPQRKLSALRLWREARPATGTLIEKYLHSRGITMPVPPSIRFHPNLRHPSGIYLPAMVAAVEASNGQIVAIHRTWLSADGSAKADLIPPRAALGPVRGCSIRFAKATERLALAEGVETALSVAQACPALPVWCAISASNLPAVELPTCVREVVVAADGDGAGERAARAAAEKFIREGRRAFIARPNLGFQRLFEVRRCLRTPPQTRSARRSVVRKK
jgi:putative DNA primase/helicase